MLDILCKEERRVGWRLDERIAERVFRVEGGGRVSKSNLFARAGGGGLLHNLELELKTLSLPTLW